MSVVARLTAVLGVDQAQFETGMKRASKSMREFEQKAVAGAKAASAALGTIGLALGALTIRQMQSIDATNKLANSLGVNIREFQAMSMVAGEAGVEQEALAKAITTSGKALVSAAGGSKTAASAFKYLGLNVNDLLKLSPDQRFNQIATALSEVENPTVRTALAMELFGKNGLAVVNMLVDYGMKVEEARAFNDKFNISLNAIDAAKVEEANDAFGRIGLAITGLGNTLAVYFSPLITQVSEAILNAGYDGEWFGRALENAMSVATTAIDAVRIGFLGLRMAISDVAVEIARFIVDANYKIQQFAKSLIEMGGGFATLGDKILSGSQGVTDDIQGWAKGVWDFNQELKKSAEDFEFLDTKIKNAQRSAGERARVTVKKTAPPTFTSPDDTSASVGKSVQNLKTLKTTAEEAQDAQLDYNSLLKDSFKDLSQAMIEGGDVAEKFKSIALNALSKIAEALINNVFSQSSGGGGGFLSSLVGGLGSIFGGMFGGSSMGFSPTQGAAVFAGMPSFDVGTDYVPNDMVAKIHKGEMIIPANEASQMRRDSGTNVTQNITIGAGVSGAVRQEVLRMLPDIRKATIQGVTDANMRGSI
jgi:hypothetical protein